MKTIMLARTDGSDKGTFGQMTLDGNVIAVTCELPWYDNTPQISCIPEGTYNCISHDTPAHPKTWKVSNVPDRSEILIHNGNVEENSRGCILIGTEFGELNGEKAVLHSINALDSFRAIMAWPTPFVLTIINQEDTND